jgi:hypothetical protein
LPISYSDAAACLAYFWVDHDRATAVASRLPDLTAARLAGGRALVGLGFYVYRQTSIGPYNEVGLAVAVAAPQDRSPLLWAVDLLRSPRRRRLGFHIIDLPVTSEVANAAGQEIWGFPKFVTRLPIEMSSERFSGEVRDPETDEIVARLAGSPPRGLPLPATDLVLFSTHEGRELRTTVSTRGWMWTSTGSDFALRIGDSKHRMAGHLTALGLQTAQPFLVQRCRRFRALLPLGEPCEGR